MRKYQIYAIVIAAICLLPATITVFAEDTRTDYIYTSDNFKKAPIDADEIRVSPYPVTRGLDIKMADDAGQSAVRFKNKSGTAVLTIDSIGNLGPTDSIASSLSTAIADKSNLKIVYPDSDSNSDHTRINAAFTAFGSLGGEVFLAPGTYEITSPLVVPSNCTLSGCGDSTRIAVGTHTESYIRAIINRNAEIGTYAQAADATERDSNITIQNLYVDGGNLTNTIDDQQDSTIHLYGVDNLRINNVTIYHGGYLAIMTEWARQIDVSGCVIRYSSAGGVGFLRESCDFTCIGNRTESNGFDDIIYFDSGKDAFVPGETVCQPIVNYDNETGGFVVGEVITGGTNSYTATIAYLIDNGTTGTLYLTDKTGDFENNETLTGSIGGAALAQGATTTAGIATITGVTIMAGSWAGDDASGYLTVKDPEVYVFRDNCQLVSTSGKAMKNGVSRRYAHANYYYPDTMPGSCYKAQDGAYRGTISGNVARNSACYAYAVYNHPSMSGSHDVTITGNYASRCMVGVSLSGDNATDKTYNVTISGNTFLRDFTWATPYAVSSGGYCYNIIYSGNNVYDCSLLYLNATNSNWVISDNHATNASTDIAYGIKIPVSTVTDIKISGNIISGFTSQSLYFSASMVSANRVSITDNHFIGSTYGIGFNPTSDKWTNCIVGSNLYDGTEYYNGADSGSNTLPTDWTSMD